METGGSFSHKQRQRVATKGAYGLFQLDPRGKLPAYRQWLLQAGRNDTPSSQVAFFHATIYGRLQGVVGRGHTKRLRAALDEGGVEAATEALVRLWFRPGTPHLDRRLKSARGHYRRLLNKY